MNLYLFYDKSSGAKNVYISDIEYSQKMYAHSIILLKFRNKSSKIVSMRRTIFWDCQTGDGPLFYLIFIWI